MDDTNQELVPAKPVNKQKLFRKRDYEAHSHARMLNSAIRSNRWGKDKTVHLKYRKANGEVVTRKVKPLTAKGMNLVAHDHTRGAIRSFRIDRIESMEKSAFWQGFEKAASRRG